VNGTCEKDSTWTLKTSHRPIKGMPLYVESDPVLIFIKVAMG